MQTHNLSECHKVHHCDKQYQTPKEKIYSLFREFITHPFFMDYQFLQVKSKEQWDAVTALRLKVYRNELPYMLSQLEEGEDNYDKYSYHYAVYYQGKMAASIRLTPHPFETIKYLTEDKLCGFLGEDYPEDYLEWTRLLVDTSLTKRGLSKALVLYAGLHVLMTTPYQKYFGYTRDNVKRILSTFRFSKETLTFNIPCRGSHQYSLFKGSFVDDIDTLKKFLMRAS